MHRAQNILTLLAKHTGGNWPKMEQKMTATLFHWLTNNQIIISNHVFLVTNHLILSHFTIRAFCLTETSIPLLGKALRNVTFSCHLLFRFGGFRLSVWPWTFTQPLHPYSQRNRSLSRLDILKEEISGTCFMCTFKIANGKDLWQGGKDCLCVRVSEQLL